MDFNESVKINRIESVDSLRGFALLGIILANIPYQFNLSNDSATDSLIDFLFYFLIDKKFITIFSILFGFGFYQQLIKANETNIHFPKYFLVRMILLFFIGSVHALVWNGDILRAYALGGILLLIIRNWPIKRILVLSGLLIIILTGIFYIILTVFGWATHNYDAVAAGILPFTTSFPEYLKLNVMFDPWMNFFRDMPLTLFFTFGNMLIGFILAKINFFQLPGIYTNLRIWLLTLGVTFGFASSFIYYNINTGIIKLDISMFWVPFVLIVGLVLQSFSYIISFLELYNRKGMKKFLRVFNPVGRTALSSYVAQSLFYVIVFYHFIPLFQLLGKLNHLESWLNALAFFFLQAIFSHLWLKKFRQGPIELIWKRISYSYAYSVKQF